jgi:EAL domain-containing protein (putative c-di-GMP-specific phosphodiesterase class I)/DNA-binding NarL/FixJ family response regulator
MSVNISAVPQGGGGDMAVHSPLLRAQVMMVDDDPLMTDLIHVYLEDAGYTNFLVTNDPANAMAMLRREKPGVLLLDLMMPGISGFDLLEAIRADRELRFTPVIVLTAEARAESKLRALQLGASDFLAKPVDASELVLRVRNTLAFQEYHRRLVHFDMVTGLPTLELFEQGIEQILLRREGVGGMVALLTVFIPQFRMVRESLDDASADEIAREIARRLERVASPGVLNVSYATSTEQAPRIARLGGDKFGLIFEGLPDAEAAEEIAQRVVSAVAPVIRVGMHDVGPSAWIGIAMAPGDGLTADVLRKGSNLAATHAMEQNSSPFKFASAQLHARSIERMAFGSQLRSAVRRDELRLHYQPKVDIASGRIVGAEALVRWQHPDLGLLPPGRFIALAEELGLINGIGLWVIETVCKDVSSWAAAGLGELSVAVNVSKPQFASRQFAAEVTAALRDSGMPARQLIVELTESMLIDDVPESLAVMQTLKSLGIALSIDDFGTGFSSLSYLKRFPLDELKIDRSFVVDLPGTAADVAVAGTVIDLGHRLGMSVTAEGVETPEQLKCLADQGCDNYQGYLFSRPVPRSELEALLARTLAAGKAIRA